MNWKEWWCLKWHKQLVVVRHYIGSKKVKCERCGCEFGMHDGLEICLPWREIADDMELFDKFSREYKP